MTGELLDADTMQKQLSGSMKLVEVTCELAALHDLDRILETVTSRVCEALRCERASLYLYDEAKQTLRTHVATELEIAEIRTPVESGVTGWVARQREVANIRDPQSDERWNSSIDRKTGFQTKNILAAPLISVHDDRLIGVLQLLNKNDGCFDAFDEQLVQAFALHAATALERAQLLEDARQSHELQISINMGHRIQASFLPSRLPDVPGYELAAWWEPAQSVSGDYYDLVQLPDGRLGLVVADVSGHGVGPSLIMASVRAMMHVLSRTRSEPEQILSLLSETIAPDLGEGRFITFLMVALDPESHELTFANAGHGPALHFHRGSGTFSPLKSTGLPLGFATDFNVPAGNTVKLEPGDLLLLATDGTIEVPNAEGELFGRERLEKLIAENPHLPAPALLKVIRKAISEYHPATHPPDDVTVMILERKFRNDAPTSSK
ncbi:MAG: PP2C family protein-serine/threonine phosphatase [Planctomycetaceae bacterium]